ncbi:MAG: FKBP-type peptidyl-prolyl cis-trans isomerase [Ferruginibacter sp.]|nr:FKBP-type peptidyl-prolyl cis-trans isomerase [Cytophagales bacterium]
MSYASNTPRRTYRFRPFRWALGLAIGLVLPGCLKSEDTDLQKRIKDDDDQIQKYFKDLSVGVDKDNLGLYFSVLEANPDGQLAQANDILSIYYVVSPLNGPVFDSLTVRDGPPLKLKLLANALVPVGLDRGLSRMREGEKYRFFIPSALAYGKYQYSAAFPEYTNLVVDAEVVRIETEAEQQAVETRAIRQHLAAHQLDDVDSLDAGLFYQRIREGQGSLPQAGQQVRLNYVGKYLNGTVFDENTAGSFGFVIGGKKVIAGFEEGVMRMRKGEKGRIFIPSHLAYGATLQVIPQRIREDLIRQEQIENEDRIPPFSVLVFEVELLDIS